MTKSRMIVLFLLLGAVLAGCKQAPATQMPATLPTRIAVSPSPTPPLGPVMDNGRARPVVASQVPRITPQELQALMASARNVILIDTRSNEGYVAGHIPGAINMLESEVQAHYQGLPRNAKIVLYCA
jgi:hypothetical protein